MMLDNAWTIWATIAGLLIIAELFTGTFFLLVIALGALAAFTLALMNFSMAIQILAAAIFMLAGIYSLWRRITSIPKSNFFKPKQLNKSMSVASNLDQGQVVLVESWQNKRATTLYRGAEWQVALSNRILQEPTPGRFIITQIDGITLVVEPVKKEQL